MSDEIAGRQRWKLSTHLKNRWELRTVARIRYVTGARGMIAVRHARSVDAW